MTANRFTVRDYVSTSEAARALGVSDSSVKRWCDLGIIASANTVGGHRRIQVREIIRFVRKDKRAIVNSQLLGLPQRTGQRRYSSECSYDRVFRSLRAGDEDRFRRVAIDLFLSGWQMSALFDEVLCPAFSAIGDLWHSGELEIYEEHRSCELCIRLLHEFRYLLTEPARSAPLAVGASVYGDPYTLSGQMAELVFIEAGWRVKPLGHSIPIVSLTAAVENLRPSVFWMTLSHIPDVALFLDGYREFAQSLQRRGIPLVVGGRALTTELRKRMLFSSFGDNFAHLRSFADTLHLMLPSSA
jgi:excisionase family DNA binding protein